MEVDSQSLNAGSNVYEFRRLKRRVATVHAAIVANLDSVAEKPEVL